ncbi:hypothetical protein PGTUg99_013393 [Puccinia graminis f. sp. tritici]|uniref:Uncharacterized protein n=1 Tax=Puccinia graminis f. sp. tritici TaxID=56615 RepID=A0A5B0S9C5_PUCGR|nr:hypothetical protein PGTUg99_013393 [Puccinia graminis f. sp. tritici]
MYSASPPILTSQGEGQNDGWVVTDQWPLAMTAAAKTNSAESFAPGVFSLHVRVIRSVPRIIIMSRRLKTLVVIKLLHNNPVT